MDPSDSDDSPAHSQFPTSMSVPQTGERARREGPIGLRRPTPDGYLGAIHVIAIILKMSIELADITPDTSRILL